MSELTMEQVEDGPGEPFYAGWLRLLDRRPFAYLCVCPDCATGTQEERMARRASIIAAINGHTTLRSRLEEETKRAEELDKLTTMQHGGISMLHQQVADLTAKLASGKELVAHLRIELAAAQATIARLEKKSKRFDNELQKAIEIDDSTVAQLQATKDAAYLERNHLVAALARCFPSGIRHTAIEGWSPDWHGCIYIDLPAGQVSYHYHDSQAELFAALPAYDKPYDGHSKEDVHARLQSVQLHSTLTAQREEIGRLRAALRGLLIEINHTTCCDAEGRRYNTYKSGIELRNLSRAVKVCEQALDEGTKEAS